MPQYSLESWLVFALKENLAVSFIGDHNGNVIVRISELQKQNNRITTMVTVFEPITGDWSEVMASAVDRAITMHAVRTGENELRLRAKNEDGNQSLTGN